MSIIPADSFQAATDRESIGHLGIRLSMEDITSLVASPEPEQHVEPTLAHPQLYPTSGLSVIPEEESVQSTTPGESGVLDPMSPLDTHVPTPFAQAVSEAAAAAQMTSCNAAGAHPPKRHTASASIKSEQAHEVHLPIVGLPEDALRAGMAKNEMLSSTSASEPGRMHGDVVLTTPHMLPLLADEAPLLATNDVMVVGSLSMHNGNRQEGEILSDIEDSSCRVADTLHDTFPQVTAADRQHMPGDDAEKRIPAPNAQLADPLVTASIQHEASTCTFHAPAPLRVGVSHDSLRPHTRLSPAATKVARVELEPAEAAGRESEPHDSAGMLVPRTRAQPTAEPAARAVSHRNEKGEGVVGCRAAADNAWELSTVGAALDAAHYGTSCTSVSASVLAGNSSVSTSGALPTQPPGPGDRDSLLPHQPVDVVSDANASPNNFSDAVTTETFKRGCTASDAPTFRDPAEAAGTVSMHLADPPQPQLGGHEGAGTNQVAREHSGHVQTLSGLSKDAALGGAGSTTATATSGSISAIHCGPSLPPSKSDQRAQALEGAVVSAPLNRGSDWDVLALPSPSHSKGSAAATRGINPDVHLRHQDGLPANLALAERSTAAGAPVAAGKPSMPSSAHVMQKCSMTDGTTAGAGAGVKGGGWKGQPVAVRLPPIADDSVEPEHGAALMTKSGLGTSQNSTTDTSNRAGDPAGDDGHLMSGAQAEPSSSSSGHSAARTGAPALKADVLQAEAAADTGAGEMHQAEDGEESTRAAAHVPLPTRIPAPKLCAAGANPYDDADADEERGRKRQAHSVSAAPLDVRQMAAAQVGVSAPSVGVGQKKGRTTEERDEKAAKGVGSGEYLGGYGSVGPSSMVDPKHAALQTDRVKPDATAGSPSFCNDAVSSSGLLEGTNHESLPTDMKHEAMQRAEHGLSPGKADDFGVALPATALAIAAEARVKVDEARRHAEELHGAPFLLV
jgi:hypothetical protein